jgi:hypothetical protein
VYEFVFGLMTLSVFLYPANAHRFAVPEGATVRRT